MLWHSPNKPDDTYLTRFSELLIDPIQGRIFNKEGKELGTAGRYWKLSISVAGKEKHFKRSHIIYWKVYNKWPESELDHKDQNRLNDAIDNLEESTRIKQCANRSSGVIRDLPVGVYLTRNPKIKKPYAARYKQKHLGTYATPEEASLIYQQAKMKERNNG